ncbi:hypothetical protein [Mycobacterium sp. PS03-16]|nr:hypothetical protein [Mycobacterium sp. PS03-16]
MATGIVSFAAMDHGHRIVGEPLMVLAAALLPCLVVAAIRSWRRGA